MPRWTAWSIVGATTFTLVVRAYGTDRWVAAVLATLPGGAPAPLFVVLAGLALCALVLDAFELIFVVVPVSSRKISRR